MPEALIIIDVQRAFFSFQPGPVNARAVIERINRLARRARAQGLPVVVIQHDHPSEGPEFGSSEWNLDERLEVNAADLRIRKHTPDSFHGTELETALKTRNIRHVVICGYATEFCVDTTTRRAAALGFEVTLAEDAHTTEDKAHLKAAEIIKHHNATLPEITSFGVRIVARPAESIW